MDAIGRERNVELVCQACNTQETFVDRDGTYRTDPIKHLGQMPVIVARGDGVGK